MFATEQQRPEVIQSDGGRGRKRRKSFRPILQTTAPKTIMFQSLGCPRNFVDTEVMMGITVQSGMQLTQDVTKADYLVVNTCGFLESARQESLDAIQALMAAKNRSSKLLVTGCMVNLHKEQILRDYPQVDSVLGSGSVDQILQTIATLEEAEEKQPHTTPLHVITNIDESDHSIPTETAVTSPSSSAPRKRNNNKSFLEQGDTPRFLATPPHYAYLKIAEGCKKQCSFCIIPRIKGKLQSKHPSQIVEEFLTLSERASEIILIAQDLGDYGKDLLITGTQAGPSSATNDKIDLAVLLSKLLEATDDPNLWLRLLYLYPDEITPQILDLMESDTRICRYLDMPIQHSHNDILKLMRRKTSAEQIQTTIETLRQRLPGIHVRTSLMVGFPGETDDHFEHLLQFVKDMELDNVGVFMYSNESMAHSSRLPNHVSQEIKEDRYDRLMQVQWEIVQRKHQAKLNTRLEVVVEGLNTQGDVVGRYYGQCPEIDGQVILLDENNSNEHRQRRQRRRGLRKNEKRHGMVAGGQRYWVEVTGYDEYDLTARRILE